MNPYSSTKDLGSFLGGGGYYEAKSKGKQAANQQENYFDSKDINEEDGFHTSGHINYMLKLQDDPGTNAKGATLEMEKSNMKLNFSIPPKSGGRLFASCEGNAGFLRQRGFQTSTLTLGYRLWHNTAISYDWTTCDGLSKNSYGVCYERHQSRTKIKLHCPPAVKNLHGPNVLSVNNSTSITDKISAEVEMDMSVIGMEEAHPFSKLRIGLKTIHDLALPHVTIYIDFFQRAPLTLCYQRYSDEDKHSSTEVILDLGRNDFQAKVLATQILDSFTSFSVGVGHSSFDGLSWIFRLQKSDLCLNVPIKIMPCVLSTYNSFIYSLSTAYLSFLSYCIHLICQELTGIQRGDLKLDLKREEDLLSIEKARKDAENQIMLMKKKADMSRRSEESKLGLVIENAIYSIEGGERLDVTVPLQFWVTESTLTLSPSSFGCMLGFYNIKRKQPRHAMKSGSNGFVSLLKYLLADTATHEEAMPILYVRYKFNLKTYEIYIPDNEALVLPSPRAIEMR